MIKMRVLVIALATLAMLVGCDTFVSTKTRMERATKAVADNDYGRAIVELRNVLQSEPQNAKARIKLVEALILNNELPAIDAELPKLASAGANDPDAQAVLARVFVAKRDFQGLINALDQHKLHFDAANERVHRAQALLGLRKPAEADALLKQTLQERPDDLEAALLHAQALAAEDASGDALAELDKLLKAAPKNARAWAAKGYLYAQQGAALPAAQALTQANRNAGGQLTRVEELGTLALLVEQQLLLGNVKAAQGAQTQLNGFFPNSPVATLAAGEVAFAQANYADVVSRMQSLLAKQSDLQAARLLLARALTAQGNYRQAESELQKVVNAVPQNALARVTLAQVELKLQQPAQALEVLAPVATSTSDQQAINSLSEAQAAVAGSEKELNDLVDALAREPGNDSLRVVTASTLLRAGKTQPAIDLLRDVRSAPFSARRVPLLLKALSVQSSPNAARSEAERIGNEHAREPEYLVAIANFFSLQKDYASAGSWLERALNVVRANDSAKANELPLLRQLIATELADGKQAEALGQVQAYRSAHPNDANAFILEADVQTELRDFKSALAASSTAYALAPSSRTVLKLANAKRLTGSATPYEDLVRWLENNPEDTSTRLALADLYMALKKQPEAAREYEKVIDAQPSNVMALNNLAWLYQQQGDARAESTARKAYALSPSPAVADTLGWLLLKNGKTTEAVELLAKAAAQAPSQPDIQYHYVAALSKSGKTTEARERLNALLAKNPSFDARKEAEQTLAQLGTQ